MRIWGKIIGFALGLLLTHGNILGGLLGAFIGHQLDMGSDHVDSMMGGGSQQRVQQAFFEALFSVLGRVAKADGHVSPVEIQVAEQLMAQMHLNRSQRQEAIRLFNRGKQAHFDVSEAVQRFRAVSARHRNLHQMFIEVLLDAAMVDGPMHPGERDVLVLACVNLGFSRDDFDRLVSMRSGQRRQSKAQSSQVSNPYQVLGITREASDAEVKKAYRRLMSQHHPDKLISKGLPQEMMDMAKKRVREIRAAYDQIKEERGLR